METKLTSGARGESIAARTLRDAGLTIVATNYRCDVGELDLVARDGDLLVFVEVRSRAAGDHGDAVEMVIASKRRKVARVAAAYLAVEAPAWYLRARFDIIAITDDEIVWIPDAWRI